MYVAEKAGLFWHAAVRRVPSPHFSHAIWKLQYRIQSHGRIMLMLRMVFDLPDFARSFPAPPVGSVVGEVCGRAMSGSCGSGAGAAQQSMRQRKLLLIGTG